MSRRAAPLLFLLALGLAALVWLFAAGGRREAGGEASGGGRGGDVDGRAALLPGDEPVATEEERVAARLVDGEADAAGRASLPAVRGRVLTADGKPAPGFRVQLATDVEVLAETRSGADGRFRLPLPGTQAVWVELVLPEGWVCTEQRRRIEAGAPPATREASGATAGDAPSARASDEIRFEVRRLRRGPVRGVVVDRATGEPVPHFVLRLVDSGGFRGVAVSRADGSFASADEYVEGNLFVAPLDQPAYEELEDTGFLHPHLAPGAPEDVRLEVRVGPTYRLGLAGPPVLDLAQLEARLRSGDGSASGEDASRTAPVNAAPGGGLPWVRFRPLEARLAGPPFRLEVASRDGVWAGSGAVDSIRGVQREPVAIELTARGRLRGRVLDDSGSSVASAVVALLPATAAEHAGDSDGARTPRGEPEQRVRTRGNGLFDLRWVPPGRYRLRVLGREHLVHEEPVRILPGETTERDVRLERAPVGGDVRGRIEAFAPSFGTVAVGNVDLVLESGNVGLVLESRTRPDRRFETTAPLREMDGDTWSGQFGFVDVPRDEYELRVTAPDAFRWEPPRAFVTPPDESLLFVFRGDVEVANLALLVTDRATGEELPAFDVETWQGGDARLGVFRGTSFANPYVLGRFALDGELTWVVGAPGYRVQRGDLSDFTEEGRSLRVARVELERGWGADVVVLEQETREPVADALILFDGEEAGRTDEDGRLEAEWSLPPGRIEVRVTGRRLVGGDVVPDGSPGTSGGRLPPGRLRYELLLGPF